MHPAERRMRPHRGRACALLLPFMGLLGGCAATTFTVEVQSVDAMNRGRPLYMLVRNVDQKTFLTESYQVVANQVIAPDPSVLDAEVIFPGSRRLLEVPRQSKTPVAVYFLFTAPASGTSWKLLIDQPLPAHVQVQLGVDGIQGSGRRTSPVAPGEAPASITTAPPSAEPPATPAAPKMPGS